MAGVDVVHKKEFDKNQELEFVHGKLYIEVLDFLCSNQDTSQIEKLLKTVPNQFKEKYKRFFGKFKEAFRKKDDAVAEALKATKFDSVKTLVIINMGLNETIWAHHKNITIDKKAKILFDLQENSTIRTHYPGFYEFVVPLAILSKIIGEGSKGYTGAFFYEGTKITYILSVDFTGRESHLTPYGIDNKKYDKSIRAHELHHILRHARDEIISKKQGDFSEFKGLKIEKEAEQAFVHFQDELAAYLISTIMGELNKMRSLFLGQLIYGHANNKSLAPIIEQYLLEIKKCLGCLEPGWPADRNFDNLKVYLYPLMAATDFKDMIQRLKQTKIKYFFIVSSF